MKGAAVPDFLAARKKPRVRLKFPQEAGGPSGWFGPVSYTHLDVYKRQVQRHQAAGMIEPGAGLGQPQRIIADAVLAGFEAAA